MHTHPSHPDITITVKVFGGLREGLQSNALSRRLTADATLRQLLDGLHADVPELAGQLIDGLQAGYLNALVNGRNIQFLKKLDTALCDGDTVAFLPPVGGG